MTAQPSEPRDGPTAPSRIHLFAASRTALLVAGAWAFAEATLWFVVPDVFAGFVVLFAPRRFARALSMVAGGALLGALVLTWLTIATGGIGGLLVALPGITPADMAQARGELQAQGAIALLNGPLQGLPVKIYVHEAALLGTPIPAVAAFVVLNRIARVGISLVVALAAGWMLRRRIAHRPLLALALYVGVWVVIYASYYAVRPI